MSSIVSLFCLLASIASAKVENWYFDFFDGRKMLDIRHFGPDGEPTETIRMILDGEYSEGKTSYSMTEIVSYGGELRARKILWREVGDLLFGVTTNPDGTDGLFRYRVREITDDLVVYDITNGPETVARVRVRNRDDYVSIDSQFFDRQGSVILTSRAKVSKDQEPNK